VMIVLAKSPFAIH